MASEQPKYDVAISFLSQDEPIAAAIQERLSEGLQVFFYPRSQEELAGTDGLESMRKPFFGTSRVVLVLYRERWGKTPWTRVEETAIKEACLEHGWEGLLFVVLDRKSAVPIWLPKTHIRFNYEDFGLEQLVGAIKARVQERGGQQLPLTPLRRAEIFLAEQRYERDKARMNSHEGLEAILNSVSQLFQEIKKHCDQVNSQGLIQIRCEIDFRERNQIQSCGITNGQVSLSVVWNQLYTNSLDHSSLVVRQFKGGFPPPGRMAITPPRVLGEIKYSPDLSHAREYGWKEDGRTEFLSPSALAERCLIRLIDLAERDARNQLQNGAYE